LLPELAKEVAAALKWKMQILCFRPDTHLLRSCLYLCSEDSPFQL
jgi:hypothetical protein